MALSNAVISIVSVAAVILCSLVLCFDCKTTVQGLRLENFSEQHVKGCYNYNQTLGICFDVGKDFMKLATKAGEEIVFHLDLGPNMFYYNVLGQGFIGHGPSVMYVPDAIPRVPHELREFVVTTQTTQKTATEFEALSLVQTHYQEALRDLHSVPEVQLLELVSVTLNKNATQLDILKPFHALCFNLLKTSNIQTPAELRAGYDSDDETAGQFGKRSKRCSSLTSDPHNNTCTGMCGPSCTCWTWVCGDCCWHSGCYKHDMCCELNPLSAHCLFPWFYEFTCDSYLTC